MMSGKNSKLAYVNLRVGRKEIAKVKTFYTGIGMANHKLEKEGAYEVQQFEWSKSTQSCGIQYFFNDDVEGKYSASSSDVYWKIGFSVHDAKAAMAKMSQVMKQPFAQQQQPSQFLDVGYLAHVRDPAGYTVELLQTTFEDNEAKRAALYRRSGAGNGEGHLGNGSEDPVIGQITTRSGDIDASLKFYQETLGMKLLCVEPVTQYGFDLYFLAFTDESPPKPKDLKAVKNREWTYQRPYTTLEIQVSDKSKPSPGPQEQAGFDSITIFADEKLWNSLATVHNAKRQGDASYVLRDPDGIKIIVYQARQ